MVMNTPDQQIFNTHVQQLFNATTFNIFHKKYQHFVDAKFVNFDQHFFIICIEKYSIMINNVEPACTPSRQVVRTTAEARGRTGHRVGRRA